MLVVGREKERDLLSTCMGSGRPEFIVVYGRRRVGKTYLVKEYFKGRFAFYATGVTEVSLKAQLRSFNDSLLQYGGTDRSTPKDWFEAFSRLRALLEGPDVQKGGRSSFWTSFPGWTPPGRTSRARWTISGTAGPRHRRT